MLDKIEGYYNYMKFLEKLRKGKEKSTFFHDGIVVRYTEILLVINSIKIN
jgi:hypothetical protein